jgi:hypothetical protein
MSLATQDILQTTGLNVLNRTAIKLLFPAQQIIYEGFYPATSAAAANMIPGSTPASIVYVRHAGTNDNLTVSIQVPNAVSAYSFNITPGGIFLYAIPIIISASATGITLLAVQDTGGSGPQPAEILIAI